MEKTRQIHICPLGKCNSYLITKDINERGTYEDLIATIATTLTYESAICVNSTVIPGIHVSNEEDIESLPQNCDLLVMDDILPEQMQSIIDWVAPRYIIATASQPCSIYFDCILTKSLNHVTRTMIKWNERDFNCILDAVPGGFLDIFTLDYIIPDRQRHNME